MARYINKRIIIFTAKELIRRNFTYTLFKGIARKSRFTLTAETSRRIRADSISTTSSRGSIYRITFIYV